MSLTREFKEGIEPEDSRGTYVSLKVINCVELAEHFKSQGLNIIKPSELHCTVAYSTKTFEHEDNPETIVVSPVEVDMHLSTLGDNCIVLKIDNKEMITILFFLSINRPFQTMKKSLFRLFYINV